MRFNFAQSLQVGTIVSRPNRFIMNIELNGVQHLAHCPTTGRIGGICFSEGTIPCLLSESNDPKRKTKYTVEAISLQGTVGSFNAGEWIGINQMRANTYVKHFLEGKALNSMLDGDVKSEVSIGKSRLDFRVGRNFLEVKMPLIHLPVPEHIKKLKPTKGKPAFDRLIKHFGELGETIGESNEDMEKKAILAMVFMYNARPFVPPEAAAQNRDIMNAAARAKEQGVENWQINMRIDAEGVELIDYFRLFL